MKAIQCTSGRWFLTELELESELQFTNTVYKYYKYLQFTVYKYIQNF